jgi:hypothetical protein
MGTLKAMFVSVGAVIGNLRTLKSQNDCIEDKTGHYASERAHSNFTKMAVNLV